MATLTRTMVLATQRRTAAPDTFARGQTRCFFSPLAKKGTMRLLCAAVFATYVKILDRRSDGTQR